MKRLLSVTLLLLLTAALCSCSLFAPGEGGGKQVTLADIDAGIRAASPTKSEVTLTAAYESPMVTLTAHITVKRNGTAEAYTYDADRLLSTEEALAAGSPTERISGHLYLEGEQAMSASGEVDAELLSKVSSLSVNLPRLMAENFKDSRIKADSKGVTLTATVKDSALADMLDGAAVLSGLSFEMELTAGLVPQSLTATWTSASGAKVEYTAKYTYTPVSVP